MSFPAKHRFKHDCELPKEYFASEIHSPIDTNVNILFAWWQDKTTISLNCESRSYFRSIASLKKEKQRHIKNPKYRWIVHPFSQLNVIKNTFMAYNWFILVNLECFCGSFLCIGFYQSGAYAIPKTILGILNFLISFHSIFEFFTGFPRPKLRKVMLEPEVIRKTFLKTYFLFDFVPILISFIVLLGVLPEKVGIIMFIFVRLRWLPSFFTEIDVNVRLLNLSSATRTIIRFGIFCVLILHQWTCIIGLYTLIAKTFELNMENNWVEYHLMTRERIKLINAGVIDVQLPPIEQIELFPYYLTHLIVVICYFTGALPTNYTTISDFERFLYSLVLVTGLAFYVYSVAKVLQIFGMINVSEEKYEEMFFQLEDYILKKNFAPELRKRIFSYVDYKYNKRFFSELQISNSLSEHLRMEVLLYSCRNLISEVKIFKGLSKSVVGCILALLHQEIYLSNDKIMSNQNGNDSIFFILYGTCAIKLPSGKELTHTEDGSHFGNTFEFNDDADVSFAYSVVALEVSEIYELKKADIRYCCATYPEMFIRLENVSRYKARKYNVLYALREHSEETTDEILEQLRQGKILMHGLKRAEFAVK